MLACVNRGILVSEVNSLAPSNDNEPTRLSGILINWLLGGWSQVEPLVSSNYELVEGGHGSQAGYYAYCKLIEDGHDIASVHVAFMDHVSLLEPSPQTLIPKGLSPKDPLITGDVNLLPVLENGRNDSEIPLFQVFQEFYKVVENTEKFSELPDSDLNPILANLHSFRSADITAALCSVLRGMEIITGNHLTYRDAWGIAVLSILGAMPSANLEEYCDWISETIVKATDKSNGTKNRLTALVELALRRTGMAIFSSTGPDCLLKARGVQPSYPPVTVLEAMVTADPLKGLEDVTNSVVKEKLGLLDEQKGPGKTLAEQDENFRKIWTTLDQELETVLLEWLYSDEETIN